MSSHPQAIGITPPAEKFHVPNEILGYAMESFSAGRAENRIRHVEVPVAPVDFMSEYATVAALIDLMEILRAKKLTFEDATSEVQTLIESMSLGQPANVDPGRYTLVTGFEPDQSKWIDAVCFNIEDPLDTRGPTLYQV